MRRKPLFIFLIYIYTLRAEIQNTEEPLLNPANQSLDNTIQDIASHHTKVPVCEEEMMMDIEDCKEVEEEECGPCDEVEEVRCSVHLEVRFTPTKVQECRKVHICEEGVKQKCVTQYRKECSNQTLTKEKEEEFPMCGIIMVQNCTRCPSCEEAEKERCNEVPVMKCHMEKKMILKEVEEPVCRSLPEQLCEDCEQCYQTIRLKRSLEPMEECRTLKTNVCNITNSTTSTDNITNSTTTTDNITNSTTTPTTSAGCRLVTRTRCTPGSQVMIKKLCSKDYDWMLHQIP